MNVVNILYEFVLSKPVPCDAKEVVKRKPARSDKNRYSTAYKNGIYPVTYILIRKQTITEKGYFRKKMCDFEIRKKGKQSKTACN